MKKHSRLFVAVAAAASLGATTSALAVQPPDAVTSDANGNTAMGLDALLNLATGGNYNTASGTTTLFSNTTGGGNTADGYSALYFNTTGTANTGVGYHSLYTYSEGEDNTAVGYQALFYNSAAFNTAVGTDALLNNTTGTRNIGVGVQALTTNTSGNDNVAIGNGSLFDNTTGNSNVAIGSDALEFSTTGFQNTAVGEAALFENTTGSDNTALGQASLFFNTTGYENTAIGQNTLQNNTTGYANSAVGLQALAGNSTGANNTAFGVNALLSNTEGKGNAAQGANALYSNTTGIRNLGIGSNALYENINGSYNLALGFDAGYNATGNDNIYLNNLGVAGESQTLRLGAQGTAGVQGSGILHAYVAGVAASQVTGSAVYVTSAGQLGVLASSERFKTDVQPMGDIADKLIRLRPVTFRLKSDPSRTVQYGLIAEEVAKIYPELAIRGADGRIEGVRYEELAPMLLNEMQRQQAAVTAQSERLIALSARNDAQADEIRDLKKLVLEMHAGLQKLEAKDALVAQR